MVRILALFVTLVTFLLADPLPLNSAKAASLCSKFLAIVSKSNPKRFIAWRLREISEIKPLILRMMDDPEIPSNFKRIVETAFLDEDTKIIQLTDALRRETNFDSNATYIYDNKFSKFIFGDPHAMAQTVSGADKGAAAQNCNEEAQKRYNLDHLPKHRPLVVVQNRPLSRQANDFISLMHELSHIRFIHFLNQNLSAFSNVLPKQLVFVDEVGRFHLNRDFYDFMAERYAFQIEYTLLKATLGNYYVDAYQRYDAFLTHPESDKNYRLALSNILVDAYGITDPFVRSLSEYTIAEIFRGVPFKLRQ
ncbi:MAG: hypothetical protein IPJ71_02680 [Bdellovibrionales bacterium]|nr:hypothetical protein [Bdellovibrionales bacterium]